MKKFEYSVISEELVSICREQFGRIGSEKPKGYFERCFELQGVGDLLMWVAHLSDQYVGHVKLVWNSDYPDFRKKNIPEIQDLNVLPQYRNQGVATKLIMLCEEKAFEKSHLIGIGVGLHPGYNNAQKLYSKLGYLLNGKGVSYDNVAVKEGETHRFDDSLVMHFTKELSHE